MTFEEYFYEVWSEIPFHSIPDDYRRRNSELIESTTYDLYRLHDQDGRLHSDLARVILSNFFSSLTKIGIK